MKFKFNYKGKKVVLDVEVCDNAFSKARGLMFRKKSKPLLFVFKKPTRDAIHSFFCIPFRAIWLDEDKIIDDKIVKPFTLSVKPEKPFTYLVEIPLNNSDRFLSISDENRKI